MGGIIMKQFNLEEYLKNPNQKVVTRDGRNVRIICTDKRGADFPIVALVECENKEETCYYTKNGCWDFDAESANDLFFASEKHEGWVNVYNDDIVGYDFAVGQIFNSREQAEKSVGNDCIATVKIEWED